MAGTPAPRQAARLRGPLRLAPLAAASEKLLGGVRPAARAATTRAEREWLSLGERARQPDKTQLRLIVICIGVGSRNPTPSRWPTLRFVVCRLRGQSRALASATAIRVRQICTTHSALRAVKRLVLAGPHPRSRCSSTSLVAAAAGAMGPESDFSGRCDRDCGANALRSN